MKLIVPTMPTSTALMLATLTSTLVDVIINVEPFYTQVVVEAPSMWIIPDAVLSTVHKKLIKHYCNKRKFPSCHVIVNNKMLRLCYISNKVHRVV